MKDRHDDAVFTMTCLRQLPSEHEYVVREITRAEDAYREETEASKIVAGWRGILRESFTNRANLYMVMMMVLAKLLAQ